ncbi:G-type lectin S-receptor-like serine/threonine-protein kinase At1g34300 [Panicum virgatum]|uniref:G-type lectin S-receptor-like serine/threonine-protein kinase At1g34300 n=1 Tax=Panicum virgatum TaxID=38727 RepID=UPI0019D4F54A|nr:G-type lectin S-receptor-like serine/threonine-protein kinase At1g34300 [Panicum virgatum]
MNVETIGVDERGERRNSCAEVGRCWSPATRRCCYGTRRRPGRLLFSLDGDDTPGAVHMLHEGPRASTAPLQEKVVSRHRAWIREVRVATGRVEMQLQGPLHSRNRFSSLWQTESSSGFTLFNFSELAAATGHFSDENRLGHGGFGTVYKGKLGGGAEIAVKRLSSLSRQGLEQFKNEVQLIVKLQHTNLIRLVGYCVHEEEKLLVYEYMPNGSLNCFIFDSCAEVGRCWSPATRRCCYGTRQRPGRLLFSLDGDDTPGAVHMLHEGPRASTAPLQEKVVSRHRAWIREVRVATGRVEMQLQGPLHSRNRFSSLWQTESSSGFTLFNFSELAAATGHFSDENRLGHGGFGTVYKASGW